MHWKNKTSKAVMPYLTKDYSRLSIWISRVAMVNMAIMLNTYLKKFFWPHLLKKVITFVVLDSQLGFKSVSNSFIDLVTNS